MDAHMYDETPLGRKSEYPSDYTPSLLAPIPRWDGREALEMDSDSLPFRGVDIWNAYEVSWLDSAGKPEVAVAEILIPCTSRNIIESKSMKLYLNSLNQHCFNYRAEVVATIEQDLTMAAHGPVAVRLMPPQSFTNQPIVEPMGMCLDGMALQVTHYEPDAGLLRCESDTVIAESLYSHLLKTNCPVTHQPDWATLMIRYRGPMIDHAALLSYIISFRNHADFHEHCVERIFVDILRQCRPEALTVYARYTRRGGIDINPFRSNYEEPLGNFRLFRQ